MPILKQLPDLQDYETVWQAMLNFTECRSESTEDEIWVVEHKPVYTLGLNGKPEHIIKPENIPVIHSDRGGQATYHGPGQLVLYTMFDLKRHKLGVRSLVTLLEQAMIELLAHYGINASPRPDAPGVYIGLRKIGSIGLRIKKNCSYHGLSLNNQMDLRPFNGINTCGFSDLEVIQLIDLGVKVSQNELGSSLFKVISNKLTP